MTTSMVQMNTRLPADLKEQGDRALRRAGYTPSQAVRALWEMAARHEYEPRVVRNALDERKEKKPIKPNPFDEWEAQARALYSKMGIDMDNLPPALPYEELKELAYAERFEI